MQRFTATSATAIATLGTVLLLLTAGADAARAADTTTTRTVAGATGDDPWT
jgi:hypothetical protein